MSLVSDDIHTGGSRGGGPPPFAIKLKKNSRRIEKSVFVVIHEFYNISSIRRIAQKVP